MKTLKEYIKLIEGNEPSAGLRAVGVSAPTDLDTQPEAVTPVKIDITTSTGSDGMPVKSVIVYANSATGFDMEASDENQALLRTALKAGGVPLPDENPDVKNTSGITVLIVGDNDIQANAYGEPADRLLEILKDAGLADEEGNAIVPQQEAQPEEVPQEVTEESDDAVERVVKLSRELQGR